MSRRRKLEADIADAATGRDRGLGFMRSTRSELRYVTDLSVTDLRGAADRAARELRELDSLIQQVNWNTELLD